MGAMARPLLASALSVLVSDVVQQDILAGRNVEEGLGLCGLESHPRQTMASLQQDLGLVSQVPGDVPGV